MLAQASGLGGGCRDSQSPEGAHLSLLLALLFGTEEENLASDAATIMTGLDGK